ncbi:hypothetical protein BS47DRAFT_236198 [Hydnum rufescens UP504]|uniref:Uncharacterized protein n=1 Tax=Hydnum rufescens UP504 TaxID=1448309 RepID=A0A9P6AML5_9AGAM|nr:hypothetical protein BS47DRAFT_236198 [Hydnum rufescens UP504]
MGQSTSRRTIRAGRSNIAHSNNIATLTPSRNAVPTDPPTPGASSTATTPNSDSPGSGSRTEIDSSVHDKVISQQQPIPRKSKGTRASLVAAKRRLSGLFPKRHSTASARHQDSDSHGPVIDLSSPDSLSVPPSISPPVPGTPVLLDQHEISGSSVELVPNPSRLSVLELALATESPI